MIKPSRLIDQVSRPLLLAGVVLISAACLLLAATWWHGALAALLLLGWLAGRDGAANGAAANQCRSGSQRY